jgi:hypothetical protein
MKKQGLKLQQLAGCKDCKKNCEYAGLIAAETGSSNKFGCNSSK